MLKDIRWTVSAFGTLSKEELHDIYKVRQQVFCVEQKCIYLDIDGQDENADHLAAWCHFQREPVAYARVVKPTSIETTLSIGRVLTIPVLRGQGLGRAVLRHAMAHASAKWPKHNLRIAAQSRLVGFYQSEGFKTIGQNYLEDGLPHIDMLLSF